MDRAMLGIKRNCLACVAPYYDLGKASPSCPKCGHRYDPDAFFRTRTTKARVSQKHVEVPEVIEDESLVVDERLLEENLEAFSELSDLEEESEDDMILVPGNKTPGVRVEDNL